MREIPLIASFRLAAPAAGALLLGLAPAALAAPPAPAAPAPAMTPAAAPAPAVAAATPAPPATPPAAAVNPGVGPLIPGICILSQESLITRSKVGVAATTRLRDLAQQVQASLNAEKARLEARGKALEAKRATLSPLQLQAQGQALNQTAQALQAKAGDRSAQIDATKTKVFSQVMDIAQPYVAQAYTAHACGLLLAKETILSGNMGNDLTPEVLAAMDAKAAPLVFELEPPRGGK